MKTKKGGSVVLFVVIIFLLSQFVYAEQQPSEAVELAFFVNQKDYLVNGETIKMDVAPTIVEGRTLLPIRYVTTPLKVAISWDSVEKKVTISQSSTNIELWIGRPMARVNGEFVPIDADNDKVMPIIVNGRTMLPVRFVSETLGCRISWDAATQSIVVTRAAVGTIVQSDEPIVDQPRGQNALHDPMVVYSEKLRFKTNDGTEIGITETLKRDGSVVMVETTLNSQRDKIITETTTTYPDGSSQTSSQTCSGPIDDYIAQFEDDYEGVAYSAVPSGGLAKAVPDIQVNCKLYDSVNFETILARWGETVSNYLLEDDGALMVVTFNNGAVLVDRYNNSYQLIDSQKIAKHLETPGAFCASPDAYYVAYGQNNPTENDARTVFEIVKYDKNWNELAHVSINGQQAYTTKPFDGTAGDMAVSGNTLVLHTARERYRTEDGYNHQSQFTVVVNTDTMTLLNQADLTDFQKNHVSHSFNQDVVFADGKRILFDHGDAYPRAIVMHVAQEDDYQEVALLDIPGEIGMNQTGVAMGNATVFSDKIVLAINQMAFANATLFGTYNIEGERVFERDAKLLLIDRYNPTAGLQKTINLTDNIGKYKTSSAPQLVSAGDKLYAIWYTIEVDKSDYQETDVRKFKDGYIEIATLDQSLNVVDVKAIHDANIADRLVPLVFNGKLIFYENLLNRRQFYEFDLK